MIFLKVIKEIAKNVFFSIIIFFIIFTSLELSYRFYKHYKYQKDIKNPCYPLVAPLGPKDRLEYVFKPNSEYTLENGITYRINQKGLRDRDFDYEKPAGTYRIIALGDSYTFGWMEKLENSYPKQLERILNSPPNQKKYEVINAGIYGYNTEQEYEFLKRELVKYAPDLVILGFVVNDAEPQNIMPRSPYLEMEGVRFWLGELLKFRINILLEKFKIYDFFILHRKEYSSHAWDGFGKEEYQWKKENCLNALRNIKNLLKEQNIALLVVIFPSLEYGTPPYEKYQYKAVTNLLDAYCAKENIDVLELYPFFEGKNEKDVRQELGHLNTEGYLIAARAIAETVRRSY